ncbi:MOSC domain-containing protein [Blastopirellula marina]|uniref:MOSC domain-containing protein n=2 Tax=Pirellulales TaxID=2691354 RepID=A0A2S8FY61_9BACT|nr:MOSC domain-containing protein [Blastopirellula marina]RCS53840.1 MOSC domain-containing protein [Bremerella cremea]
MDKPWQTGFFKQPVAGSVQLHRLGFEGDGVADLVHHGGVDKAVLCYSAQHYPIWRNEFQQMDALAESFPIESFGPGAFGENLTVSGLAEETVCLGDVYEVGTARIEVSQPRQPCWKLGRRWRLKQLTALAVSTGRMGWYVRILEEGVVSADQDMVLVDRTLPEWPITRLNELFYHDRSNLEDAQTMAQCKVLAEAWRGEFRKRVEKGAG